VQRKGFSQYVVDDGHGLAKAVELAERIATNTELSNFAIVQALPRIARSDPDGDLLSSVHRALPANSAISTEPLRPVGGDA
jgi:hypothetical protein